MARAKTTLKMKTPAVQTRVAIPLMVGWRPAAALWVALAEGELEPVDEELEPEPELLAVLDEPLDEPLEEVPAGIAASVVSATKEPVTPVAFLQLATELPVPLTKLRVAH